MHYPQGETAVAVLRRGPIIPVLTVHNVEDAVALGRALRAGGLKVLEITLRTPAALHALAALAKEFPDTMIGAGTVVRPDQINSACAAGAAFLVSPGMTPLLTEAARRCPVPFLPGAATVSEMLALQESGFRALKFFPAEPAGGAKFLASVSGPLPDLLFCPTGGIDARKAPHYLALANVACVGGSWMAPQELIAAQDYARIEQLAREASALGQIP